MSLEAEAIKLREEAQRLDNLTVDPPGEPMPNAKRFIDARFSGDCVLLAHQGGVFYYYSGTCWPEIEEGDLRKRLYDFFEEAEFIEMKKEGPEYKRFAPNRYKVADLVDALKARTFTPADVPTPHWFDKRDMPADEVVACANGLVHFPTRKRFNHTPHFYQHHSVPFDFDPKAPQPKRWHKFMRELFADDQETIDALQELFGYLITADTRLQKMFLLVGPKRSGKGTIARIIKAMLGADNVAGPTLASLGSNFGLQPLIGKPAAIIADARLKGGDSSVVTERLLSISGEDTLTVDRKYRDPWTGKIPSRIVILSNELPRLADSSGALASRFIVMTMRNSFYGKEDITLTDKLMTELPGIFNWALDGLERLRDRGHLVQPEASQEAIRELEDLSSPVGAFVRDRCEIGPEHQVTIDALYQAWKDWCEDRGHHAGSSQVFGRNLRSAFPNIRVTQPRMPDGSNPRQYAGVGLTRDDTRATSMYCPEESHAATRQNNGPSRVSARVSTPDDEEIEI